MTHGTCEACGTPFTGRCRTKRYCTDRCKRRAEKQRGRSRGAEWALTRHKKTTLDLVDGVIVGTVRLEDYGRFGALVRRDPCAYCGAASTDLDHIVPRASGGPNGWDNRTPSCAACNNLKSNRSLLGHMLSRRADAERAHLLARLDDVRAELATFAALGPPPTPPHLRPRHHSPGRCRNPSRTR